MTTPSLAQVPVRSAAELTRRWATVLEPPVFADRSAWLMWLAPDGRALPLVVPVDDLPAVPGSAALTGLRTLHEAVVEGSPIGRAHLAVALCRPGHAVVTASDDAWLEALRATFDPLPDGTWSLHLAAGGRVVPLVDAPEGTWRRG
jgi:hypothetical protein